MASRPAERDSFVVVLARRGRFTVGERLFERGRRVTVELRRRGEARPGDMVLVRERRPGSGRAEIVRVLGRPDVARDVVEALLAERGHARRFPERVEREAIEGATRSDERPRRDLTALPTFTIDPSQARDFDDAVSAERKGDMVRAHIHIADVAAHVKLGSALDAEAHRRGNSVYVPGAVEPMLPQALSSDACSLVPGEPRRAVTVELLLDGESQVRSTAFYRSLIRSDCRLTYEQVDQIFAGREPYPQPVAEPLNLARAVAKTLGDRRLARGALGLETSEPEFEFDSEGNVNHAIDDVQTEAHGVIEELMILANEQVAQELGRRRKPLLYRVHEEPEPAAVEFLVAQLESLDVPTPPVPKQMSPKEAGKLVGEIGLRVMEHVRLTGHGGAALTSLVLRSLKQAYYSPQNLGHAGLASAAYAHFTSPIRRYPDLVVHRALLAAVGDDEETHPPHSLGESGFHCSQTEREATALERKADDVCLAFLLERELFENGWEREFDGEVSGLVGAGAFVSFATGERDTAPCEGFLPARRLREYYDLNELGTALVGRRSGSQLRLGDPVRVAVDAVDSPRGRVDLLPAADRDSGGEGSRGRIASRGRRR